MFISLDHYENEMPIMTRVSNAEFLGLLGYAPCRDGMGESPLPSMMEDSLLPPGAKLPLTKSQSDEKK